MRGAQSTEIDWRQGLSGHKIDDRNSVQIAVGAAVILIPRAPLQKILILSQVGNGVWLPVVLIFILLLVNRRDLMGDLVNTRTFNVVAWITVVAMIVLTLVLVYAGIFHPGSVPGLPGS